MDFGSMASCACSNARPGGQQVRTICSEGKSSGGESRSFVSCSDALAGPFDLIFEVGRAAHFSIG